MALAQRNTRTLVLLTSLVSLVACTDPNPGEADAGALDADAGDVGAPDAGLVDAGLPPSTVTVDARVVPRTRGSVDQPVGAVVGSGQARLELVSNELVIATEDDAQLATFLARFGGVDLKALRFSELGLAVPTLHHVRVSRLDEVDPAQLAADLARLSGKARRDDLRVSSLATLRILALAAQETKPGFVVSVNSILEPQGVVEGTSYEAVNWNFNNRAGEYVQDYDRNAFNWPYMSGERQNINVGDAWRSLAAAGKLVPSIRLLIIDGGFLRHDDLPAGTTMLSSWDVANGASCGGGPCPWHGTGVASAAASIIDNGVGSAGSGGPVVKLSLGQVWGEINDVGDVFSRVFETLRTLITVSGALGGSDRLIINLSASTRLSTLIDVVVTPVWGVLSAGFRAKGVMIVASAGNDSDDVDRQDCILGFCWEPNVTIPCELGNVLCVGGIQATNLNRHPESAWGSSGSVELFAPYLVWTVDDNNVRNGRAMGAKLSAGTSFSAPFVSGIAAMVWAADPTLSPGQVEQVLLDTATPSPDTQVRKVVNAGAAVRRALGSNRPRIFDWPRTPVLRTLNQPLTVALNNPALLFSYDATIRAYASVPGPMSMTLVSSDARDAVTGTTISFGGTGLRTITVTVADASGGTDSRAFDADVRVADGRLFAVLGSGTTRADQPLYAHARGFERVGVQGDPLSFFQDAPCQRVRWVVPTRQTPLGTVGVGSVVTEIDTNAVVSGGQPRTSARGCHAQFVLAQGQHQLRASLLGPDNTTVIAERFPEVAVEAAVYAEAPVLGALAIFGSNGGGPINPGQLDFSLTGVFLTARYLQVQYGDPGSQGVQSLTFSAESLVSGTKRAVPIDVANQDHAEDGELPSADNAMTPWPGTWLASAPEPSLVAFRASVTDNGLTATRPYLVRLIPKASIH